VNERGKICCPSPSFFKKNIGKIKKESKKKRKNKIKIRILIFLIVV